MKVVRMTVLDNSSNGSLKAFFDIETPDGIVMKGFKLVNGPSGLFASAPSDKGKDGKYYDSVILPKEMKSSVEKLALEEYKKSGK
jgi:stage V sporulation protein G